jgi:hypothetical protein
MRNASKVPKGLNVSPKKTFLVLRRKTSGICATRVTEMHHKKLYLLPLTSDDDVSLAPIHLRILAWFELERQK